MPSANTRCFFVRHGAAHCHVQIDPLPGQPGKLRALPWVEDRLVIRPVHGQNGEPIEFVGDAEESVVASAVEFLTRRFGSATRPPAPCPDAHEHIRVKTAPVRWTDKLD